MAPVADRELIIKIDQALVAEGKRRQLWYWSAHGCDDARHRATVRVGRTRLHGLRRALSIPRMGGSEASCRAAVPPSLPSQPNSAANAVRVTGRTRPSVSVITAEACLPPTAPRRGAADQYHSCRRFPSATRAWSILIINSRSATAAILRCRRCCASGISLSLVV
jgi:hypothetical protein